MNTGEGPQLRQVLQARCQAIAASWYNAIARTGYVPFDAAQVRQRLVELTAAVVTLLLAEPFEHERAQAIGASLASLHYVQPEALGRTQEVLGQELLAGLPADQVAMLQPRLATLLGGVAAGFFRQARAVILAEQEQIRTAHITARRQAETALRKTHDELELRVQERTTELAQANQALQVEIAERMRAEQALRRRNRELALLNRVGQQLTATRDQQQVIEQLLGAVTEFIGAMGASVWLWDEEQAGALVCRAASPSSDGPRRSPVDLRVDPGQGIAGWVAREGKSLVVPGVVDDPRFFPGIDERTGFRTLSLLAVPLRVRHTIIGVLEVVNKLSGDFNRDDLALVETLATWAAIAIDNAWLIEALHRRTVELQARNEDLDTFAHTVAHDLKNPLALVIGLAEIVAEVHAGTLDEASRQHLGTIIRSAHQMDGIVERVLLLAGVRRMDEVEIGPLDMACIVTQALEQLAYVIRERQAEIILPPGGAWPVALGYGPWVEGVWVNYISNAIKYGGRPPVVELGFDVSARPGGATEQADGMVRFWVRDNGPGLTPEEQERLFTPFAQMVQVRGQGHGLGLSIARHVVERLGGQVGVESQVGQGSLFFFTLRRG
jgi:signal transduction histidine kinase